MTTILLLTILGACGRGAPEAARVRASEGVSGEAGSVCPPSQPPGPEWRMVTTRDGRAVLTLPRRFAEVPADSAEIWGDSVSSIGYKARAAGTQHVGAGEGGQGWCTEQIGGSDARLRYQHARAAFGEGQYVRLLLRAHDGTELTLNGFARDSAAGYELLAVARSMRVRTP